MRYFFVKLALVLSCLLPLPWLHATPVAAGTYTLSGVTVGGYALNGSLTLDNSGLATAANLTWANSSYSNPAFTTINSKGVSGNNPTANFAYIAQGNGQVAFYYLQTLNASGGITICEAGTNCAQDSYLQMYSPNLNQKLTGGSLAAAAAPAAVTPEPGSWMLMLTGACMIAGVLAVRRAKPAYTRA